MLVDNCPAHSKMTHLRAITLNFLPPNTTSCLQPMDQGIIHNLKTLYRRMVVERLLCAVDRGQPVDNNTVTLLDGVRMLHSAWNQVKPETIANCFKHARFVQSDSAGPSAVVSSIAIAPDVGNLWDRLRSAGFDIPTFEDFRDADNDLASNETMTDEAIIESVTSQHDDDDDDDDIGDSMERPPPTTADAMEALAVLRNWMECSNADTKNGFKMVADLENIVISSRPMQQKSITDFFNKDTYMYTGLN